MLYWLPCTGFSCCAHQATTITSVQQLPLPRTTGEESSFTVPAQLFFFSPGVKTPTAGTALLPPQSGPTCQWPIRKALPRESREQARQPSNPLRLLFVRSVIPCHERQPDSRFPLGAHAPWRPIPPGSTPVTRARTARPMRPSARIPVVRASTTRMRASPARPCAAGLQVCDDECGSAPQPLPYIFRATSIG